jgi:hypothetical protein
LVQNAKLDRAEAEARALELLRENAPTMDDLAASDNPPALVWAWAKRAGQVSTRAKAVGKTLAEFDDRLVLLRVDSVIGEEEATASVMEVGGSGRWQTVTASGGFGWECSSAGVDAILFGRPWSEDQALYLDQDDDVSAFEWAEEHGIDGWTLLKPYDERREEQRRQERQDRLRSLSAQARERCQGLGIPIEDLSRFAGRPEDGRQYDAVVQIAQTSDDQLAALIYGGVNR